MRSKFQPSGVRVNRYISACVYKTFMLQHAKEPVFTHKTNTLHGKPDRADNALSKVYKIYGIMIIIVINVKTLLASSRPYVAPVTCLLANPTWQLSCCDAILFPGSVTF